ncbi:MAG TPA: 4Fe-4S dicluster domain-containing protein [Symbiobacteriaceae bacterium]|nr:4Fe-4S dicluster domain-containing protein [Symbiobacteriaceae bacterium]
MKITRRKLLFKGALAAGSGLALGQILALVRTRTAEAATAKRDPKDIPSVLYDLTQCAGCRFCEYACQINKGLTPDKALLTFRKPDPESAPPQVAWVIRRQQCMHCIDAGCASVCPVAAMYKTEEGPVIYRDERCLGCRYCMNACPFGVPAFDWNSGLLDAALIRKCDFCYDRQKEGKNPACIDACPAKAVIFGKRSEMLAEAKRRIAEHPDRYVNHVYGETEAGGTSFLVISSVPFEQLGMPNPGDSPLPPLSEKVMGIVPPFAVGWMATLIGITSIVKFRQRRMEENSEAKAKHEQPSGKGDAR